MILEKKVNKKNYRQAKWPSHEGRVRYHCPVSPNWFFRLLYFIYNEGMVVYGKYRIVRRSGLCIILHKTVYVVQINVDI